MEGGRQTDGCSAGWGAAGKSTDGLHCCCKRAACKYQKDPHGVASMIVNIIARSRSTLDVLRDSELKAVHRQH